MENVLINIDSRFRDKLNFPNTGKFTYNLNEVIKNVVYIRLSSFEFLNVQPVFLAEYYNISFMIVLETLDVVTITIQEGNYSSDILVNYIQGQLDLANNTYSTNFVVNWDIISLKITFSNTTPFSLIFSNGTHFYSALGYYLGFRFTDDKYDMYKTGQPIKKILGITTYYWYADTVLDISKDKYLYLRLNDYGVIYNDILEKNLFAKIILGNTLYVQDNGSNLLTKMYKFKQPVNLSKFDIELISPVGYTINMDQINYSFTLEIGQIYDNRIFETFNYKV